MNLEKKKKGLNWKRHTCPVPKCGFVSARGFFQVPEHPVRQKAWAEACELSPPFKQICWQHFDISDFKKEITEVDIQNFTFGQLKKNTVPTKHLPGNPIEPFGFSDTKLAQIVLADQTEDVPGTSENAEQVSLLKQLSLMHSV